MNLNFCKIWILASLTTAHFFFIQTLTAQDGYGNQWIFGSFSSPNPSGTLVNFNNDTLKVMPFNKSMELEGSCAIMCDSAGKLLFYSNGCYIAGANHLMMVNGDGIGKDKLETSFCNTGGNPLTQGMIALPKPESNHLYYLFYTDIGDPYASQPNIFPLAPETMYYSVIDMEQNNGLGRVIEKNVIAVKDTLSKGMMQANRHENGKDWWILMPESQSNCHWTLLLTHNGIDTIFKQCVGEVWRDRDSQGQSVFAPNSKKYVRFNYFYGLNIYDFDASTGLLSNPVNINFGQDTFYFNGAAFSSNSRFLYTVCYDKVWQFDLFAADISSSRVLIADLNTPTNISPTTRFGKARLGPDGKIYISGTNTFEHLHIIHQPNCYGTESRLEQYAIDLKVDCTHTMPNMPHYKKWSETDTCLTVGTHQMHLSQNDPIKLYPNPISDGYILTQGIKYGDYLQIFDVFGRMIQGISYVSNQLDICTLGDGFYFIAVSRGSESLGIYKIVVGKNMR